MKWGGGVHVIERWLPPLLRPLLSSLKEKFSTSLLPMVGFIALPVASVVSIEADFSVMLEQQWLQLLSPQNVGGGFHLILDILMYSDKSNRK